MFGHCFCLSSADLAAQVDNFVPEQWRFGGSRRLSVRGVQIGVRVLGLEAGEQEDMGGYS